MVEAPASTQAATTSSSWAAPSDRPGRTGATSTPHRTPAARSRATASSRWRGWGVPGSVARHTSVSTVPIERLTDTSVRCDASASRSASRTTSVDLVRMENGLRAAVEHLDQPLA